MQKSSDTMLMLSKQVKQLGATDAHFRANNIKHTKGLIGVVSVYDGIKPSHMVLEELYEWAKNNNQETKMMIEKLKNDMSWNDKNPV